MIPRRFEDISLSDIEALIENEVPESRTLDYKLTLPGKTDKDKKELVADITSFANTGGGDILFGIDEERDSEENKLGRPARIGGLTEGDVEEAILFIEHVLRSNTEPPVTDVRTKAVQGHPSGPVLLLRVGRSWLSPHRNLKDREYWARASNGKYQMDTTQLRIGFNASQDLRKQMDEFQWERHSLLTAGAAPIATLRPLPNASVVVHVIPYESILSPVLIDFVEWAKNEATRSKLHPTRSTSWSPEFNIEGYLVHSTDRYAQLFRNGILEFVSGDLTNPGEEQLVASKLMACDLVESITIAMGLYSVLGISTPFAVMPALLNTTKSRMPINRTSILAEPTRRASLIVPGKIVDSLDEDPYQLAQSILDVIWQGFGRPKCEFYDADGSWIQHRCFYD